MYLHLYFGDTRKVSPIFFPKGKSIASREYILFPSFSFSHYFYGEFDRNYPPIKGHRGIQPPYFPVIFVAFFRF